MTESLEVYLNLLLISHVINRIWHFEHTDACTLVGVLLDKINIVSLSFLDITTGILIDEIRICKRQSLG